MKQKILIIMVVILLFMVNIVTADYIKGGYIDSEKAIYGIPTYQRWDGMIQPMSNLDVNNGNYPYLFYEGLTNYVYTIDNVVLYIPKINTEVKHYIDRISPQITYSKDGLQNKMINYNDTVAYIKFPYSVNQIIEYSDTHNIKIKKLKFIANNDHIIIKDSNNTVLNNSYYDFKIVNGEIRLYFNKEEANKLEDQITFSLNSWYIGDTYSNWISNVTFDNTTVNPDNIVVGSSADWFNRVNNTNMNANTGYTKWQEVGTGLQIYNNMASREGVWDSMSDLNTSINASNYYVSYQMSSYSGDLTEQYFVTWYQNTSNGGRTSGSTWTIKGYGTETLPQYNDLYYRFIDGGQTTIDSDTATVHKTHDIITIDTSTSASGLVHYLNGSLWETFAGNSSYTNGTVNLQCQNPYSSYDYYRVFYSTWGNVTATYDAGSGYQTDRITANFSIFDTNTNYSINVYNNDTDIFIENIATNSIVESFSSLISSPVQDTKINITLYGNLSHTPELINITFHTNTSAPCNDSEPYTPENITNVSGLTYINWSWDYNNTVNITDSTNISINATSWYNGTTNFYYNLTGLTCNTTHNITVYAYNNSCNGSLNNIGLYDSYNTSLCVPTPTPLERNIIINDPYNIDNHEYGLYNDSNILIDTYIPNQLIPLPNTTNFYELRKEKQSFSYVLQDYYRWHLLFIGWVLSVGVILVMREFLKRYI